MEEVGRSGVLFRPWEIILEKVGCNISTDRNGLFSCLRPHRAVICSRFTLDVYFFFKWTPTSLPHSLRLL